MWDCTRGSINTATWHALRGATDGQQEAKIISDTLLHIGSQAPGEKNPTFNYKNLCTMNSLTVKRSINCSKRKKPCKASEPKKSLYLCCCIILYTFKEHVFLLFVALLEKKNLKKQIKLYSCISFYYNPSLITFQ